MTGNEKFRLKVVDDLRKNRVIVESDEDYITLLKKANKDLGDLVRLRDEQIAKLTAERDKVHQYWQIAEGRFDALKQQRDELVAALILASCCLEPNTSSATVNQIEAAIASVKEKQNE